ncbi:MAG: GntR family transcriptional regulator [Lactococcus petauri]
MQKSLVISEKIKHNILSGKYAVGQKLPRHTDLALEFKTSRVTISHVMKLLSQEGLVQTQKGIGTFVSSQSFIQRRVDEPLSLTRIFPDKIESQIISFEIRECDDFEQEKLHLKDNEKVYDIIRCRIVKKEPLELEYTVMPVSLIPGVTPEILLASIYEHIEKKLHIELGFSDCVFRADKVDAYDIKYLNLSERGAIFEKEQIAYLKNGAPFEFSYTRFPANKIELTATKIPLRIK